jgi:DNA-binding NarL/FixJ family response regulator
MPAGGRPRRCSHTEAAGKRQRPYCAQQPLRRHSTRRCPNAIHDLARRARIDLTEPGHVIQHEEPPAGPDRELAVLQLVSEGKTNSEIGAALYISRKTASVHVGNILRRLGVSTRVQAAALAERAGLVDRH